MKDVNLRINDSDDRDDRDENTGESVEPMNSLDRRTADEREADLRLEALLDEALTPMALVGPPGTSERAALENGFADRIYAASLAHLPRKQNSWVAALRSQRVWTSFAASMAVAVSAGIYIHTSVGSVSSARPNRSNPGMSASAADISAVDQQLSKLASYNGPSASIDRDLATLSLKIDQAGSAALWNDSRENLPTPTDW